jgi:hypothetical protein
MFRISYPSGVDFPKIWGPFDLFWRMETAENFKSLPSAAALPV